MATAPKVRQYAGDIRMWEKQADSSQLPVIPDATDPDGNQPIETNSCAFSYEPGDEVRILSKRRGTKYNQPTYADTQPGTTSITLQLLEMPPAIMARVLYGEAANADITGASVTDAPFAATILQVPLNLPHRAISSTPAPVVKKGATTLVSGTDYVIDYRRGTIMIPAGSTVLKDDALTLSYTFETVTGTTIVGGAVPTKSYYITGDMEDRIGGDQGLLTVYEARLTVDGEIDWLSAEPLQPTLKGPLVVPAGAPGPYTFNAYKTAA